jgi:hypothetical protein
MTTKPSQLLVWSGQICNHAKLIQNYTGECIPIGSLRFEELKKYAFKKINKKNKVYFCGASFPSSEICFLEYLLENSGIEVVYRPHPIGFYVNNEIALDRIKKLEKLFHNKLKVVISSYGESPEDEISNLSHDLFSYSVILCCATSTFIESISLQLPTYILNWGNADTIGGVKTNPASWFNNGYLHIDEVIKNYPLILSDHTDLEFISNIITTRNYESISKPFLKWYHDNNNSKYIIANNNSCIDFP